MIFSFIPALLGVAKTAPAEGQAPGVGRASAPEGGTGFDALLIALLGGGPAQAPAAPDAVEIPQVCVKYENGTRPHNAKTGKLGTLGVMIFVNTKVRMDTVTMGFSSDQNTPRDMFRYRTLKSFETNFRKRNP